MPPIVTMLPFLLPPIGAGVPRAKCFHGFVALYAAHTYRLRCHDAPLLPCLYSWCPTDRPADDGRPVNQRLNSTQPHPPTDYRRWVCPTRPCAFKGGPLHLPRPACALTFRPPLPACSLLHPGQQRGTEDGR